MNNETIYCIIADVGYNEIPSKNQYMRSFTNHEKRVNVYNTGTVQIQSLEGSGGGTILKDDFTSDDLIKQLTN